MGMKTPKAIRTQFFYHRVTSSSIFFYYKYYSITLSLPKVKTTQNPIRRQTSSPILQRFNPNHPLQQGDSLLEQICCTPCSYITQLFHEVCLLPTELLIFILQCLNDISAKVDSFQLVLHLQISMAIRGIIWQQKLSIAAF